MEHEFHNPDGLTPEQVGEGCRLLLKSEIKQRTKPHKEMESFLSSIDDWHKSRCGYYGDNKHVTYRVPLATWPLPPEDKQDALITSNQDKVAELEGVRGDLKTVADVLQDFAGDTVHEQAQQAVQKIDELQSKLQKAEARLKQLEWVPYSEREPTQEDTDGSGYVVVANKNQEWQTPWTYHPKEATHWRRFVPPITVDKDRAEFEKWWEANKENIASFESEALQIWKAAREVNA